MVVAALVRRLGHRKVDLGLRHGNRVNLASFGAAATVVVATAFDPVSIEVVDGSVFFDRVGGELSLMVSVFSFDRDGLFLGPDNDGKVASAQV